MNEEYCHLEGCVSIKLEKWENRKKANSRKRDMKKTREQLKAKLMKKYEAELEKILE